MRAHPRGWHLPKPLGPSKIRAMSLDDHAGSPVSGPVAPELYAYTNYRAFLKDWFESRRGRPSVRQAAARLGCSAALLSAVQGGSRDLHPPHTEKLAALVTDDSDRHAYFLALVDYEQGDTLARKREALRRVMAMRRFRTGRRLVDSTWDLFAHWYVPAVAELARCEGFREDPAWIAEVMRPRITTEQAAEALVVLQEGSFLARGEDGRLRPTEAIFRTEHEVARVERIAVAEWHRNLLERAREALDTLPADERHFASASLPMSAELLKELKAVISTFMEDVTSRTTGHPSERDRVYQLCVQLFPVSGKTRP